MGNPRNYRITASAIATQQSTHRDTEKREREREREEREEREKRELPKAEGEE